MGSRDFSTAVFIGRFQAFHNTHHEIVKQGLEIADRVVIVIGSRDAAESIKDPFAADERLQMIMASFTEAEQSRLRFTAVRDYFYNDNVWVAQVINEVHSYEENDARICVIGSYKDATSYYINMLPWHKQLTRLVSDLDASQVRQIIFNQNCGSNDFAQLMPKGAHDWICKNFLQTERHANLIAEYKFYEEHWRKWSGTPHPVTFNTVDAVVVKSGHVLMVRRGQFPGKGLLALPGGYLKQDETLFDGSIRELKEETRIEVPRDFFEKIKPQVRQKTFDYPKRSLRGRIITQAFYFDLGPGDLPRVKGGDDAAAAVWVPLLDPLRLERKVFEDHASIIGHFSGGLT